MTACSRSDTDATQNGSNEVAADSNDVSQRKDAPNSTVWGHEETFGAEASKLVQAVINAAYKGNEIALNDDLEALREYIAKSAVELRNRKQSAYLRVEGVTAESVILQSNLTTACYQNPELRDVALWFDPSSAVYLTEGATNDPSIRESEFVPRSPKVSPLDPFAGVDLKVDEEILRDDAKQLGQQFLVVVEFDVKE
jgi:hypothetical protein